MRNAEGDSFLQCLKAAWHSAIPGLRSGFANLDRQAKFVLQHWGECN